MNDQSNNQEKTSPHKVWIEQGILFHEYQGEVTLEHILENEKKSVLLIQEHNKTILPMIVTFKEVGDITFDLTLSDCAKIIAAFDLPEYISGVWIVESFQEIEKLVDLIQKSFHVSKVILAKDLQEARQGAQLLLTSSETILEE